MDISRLFPFFLLLLLLWLLFPIHISIDCSPNESGSSSQIAINKIIEWFRQIQ